MNAPAKAAPKKQQPSYKTVTISSTMGAVPDAFSAIEELASECREVFDNMESGNLGNTQRCITFGETADTLENISEVEVPDDQLAELQFSYGEAVPTRKGRNTSRDVRRSNIISLLEAAAECAREAATAANDNGFEDDAAEAEQFASELDDVVSELEGVEFPGMFG